MGLLMAQDLLKEDAPVRKRIVDAGYRLVSERQPFAAAGKFAVENRRRLTLPICSQSLL